jgi:hypothetical protein
MAEKKKRDALAGVNMAMALDSQSAQDLAKLKRMIKKPRRIRTKPVELNVKSNSIQKPGAFGIQRNDIMKAATGGEVMNTTKATLVNPLTGDPI